MLRLGSNIGGLMMLCAAAGSASAASAVPQPEARHPAAFMRVYAATEAPVGFVAMCIRSPELCGRDANAATRVELTPAHYQDLVEVNQISNHTVKPVSDIELYGMSEYWALPRNRGDCEDYAILKQQLLAERGWPKGALLLTVVRDETHQGHAVLTVRTTAGDFLLDNRFDDVKRWYEAPYQYVKRQSYLNPQLWMALAPVDRDAPGQMASTRGN